MSLSTGTTLATAFWVIDVYRGVEPGSMPHSSALSSQISCTVTCTRAQHNQLQSVHHLDVGITFHGDDIGNSVLGDRRVPRGRTWKHATLKRAQLANLSALNFPHTSISIAHAQLILKQSTKITVACSLSFARHCLSFSPFLYEEFKLWYKSLS